MKTYLSLVVLFFSTQIMAQNKDSIIIKKLFNEALLNGECYSNLEYLCANIGGRLSGSPQAEKAVEWGKMVMEGLHLDKVDVQPVMVPHWVRGEKEIGKLINPANGAKQEVPICALGGSIATPPEGLEGEIIEIKSFEEMAKLGKENIKGKIVFYNRPMDATEIETFNAYGGAVEQRWAGAMRAAQYGAIASITRSMTTDLDDQPHTGSMSYSDTIPKIPAVAISTNGAETLAAMLRGKIKAKFFLKINCQTLPDAPSFNVYGEIKGTENPNQIIVIGGHLDSWDTGDGAHDDGAGCVQSMEVLRILKAIGYKPKNTIRAVLFMNEENGLRGGKQYAQLAIEKNETHLAAIETDAGGFTPRGFSFDAPDWFKYAIKKQVHLLAPYGLHSFNHDGGGPDIGPLKKQGVPLMELLPDSQRYFKYHHTAIDTFDKVNKRELELGAASMAAMVYLIDNTVFH